MPINSLTKLFKKLLDKLGRPPRRWIRGTPPLWP